MFLDRLKKRKKIWIAVGAGAIVVMLIAVMFMMLSPKKTWVEYGTRVLDKDGNVINDDTQRALVSIADAGKYRLTVVVRDEGEESGTAAQTNQPLDTTTAPGFTTTVISVSPETVASIENLQQSIEAMNQNVITGLDMINMLDGIRASMASYRSIIANTSVPPEFEPNKQKLLQAYDLYISSIDLYLQGISTGNTAYFDQANALIQQANAILASMYPG